MARADELNRSVSDHIHMAKADWGIGRILGVARLREMGTIDWHMPKTRQWKSLKEV